MRRQAFLEHHAIEDLGADLVMNLTRANEDCVDRVFLLGKTPKFGTNNLDLRKWKRPVQENARQQEREPGNCRV